MFHINSSGDNGTFKFAFFFLYFSEMSDEEVTSFVAHWCNGSNGYAEVSPSPETFFSLQA